MLFYIGIFFLPPLAALLVALRTSGKKKFLAWGIFALLALPLVVAGGGGLLLSANGMAWRSCVKLPLGFAYVAGLLALLVWAGVFVWRIETVGRWFFVAVIGFIALVVGWYGLLFSAIWAGQDRVTEYKGQAVVEEQVWTDWDYYAYHGPLVRGKDVLGHSWEDSRDPEPKEAAEAKKNAKARKTVARALNLDIPDSGEVQRNINTHGGFHGDGVTYIQIRFHKDSGAVLEQIEANEDWQALPMPWDVRSLARHVEAGDIIVLPTDEELGEGYWFFLDRHSEAVDRHDYSAAGERYSGNFDIAFYSIGEETLCFCRVDT